MKNKFLALFAVLLTATILAGCVSSPQETTNVVQRQPKPNVGLVRCTGDFERDGDFYGFIGVATFLNTGEAGGHGGLIIEVTDKGQGVAKYAVYSRYLQPNEFQDKSIRIDLEEFGNHYYQYSCK